MQRIIETHSIGTSLFLITSLFLLIDSCSSSHLWDKRWTSIRHLVCGMIDSWVVQCKVSSLCWVLADLRDFQNFFHFSYGLCESSFQPSWALPTSYQLPSVWLRNCNTKPLLYQSKAVFEQLHMLFDGCYLQNKNQNSTEPKIRDQGNLEVSDEKTTKITKENKTKDHYQGNKEIRKRKSL